MRIPKSWVPLMAKRIVDGLLEKDLIEAEVPSEQLIPIAEEILLEELMVEDRINEEVREILKRHEKEIEHKRLDYRKLFEMTKQKVVRERNIIL